MLAKLVSASHKWLLGLSSMLPNNRILPEDKSKADGQATDVFYIQACYEFHNKQFHYAQHDQK